MNHGNSPHICLLFSSVLLCLFHWPALCLCVVSFVVKCLPVCLYTVHSACLVHCQSVSFGLSLPVSLHTDDFIHAFSVFDVQYFLLRFFMSLPEHYGITCWVGGLSAGVWVIRLYPCCTNQENSACCSAPTALSIDCRTASSARLQWLQANVAGGIVDRGFIVSPFCLMFIWSIREDLMGGTRLRQLLQVSIRLTPVHLPFGTGLNMPLVFIWSTFCDGTVVVYSSDSQAGLFTLGGTCAVAWGKRKIVE